MRDAIREANAIFQEWKRSSFHTGDSMDISDEIEDATIAIDETKISEIEATKRRFRNYCVQTKY